MVWRPDQPFLLHTFDKARGAIVADAQLPLEPACRGLLIFEHELTGPAEQLRIRAVIAQIDAIERETAFLRLFCDGGDIVGLALGAPMIGNGAHFVVGHERAMDTHQALAAMHVEHVALAKQLLSALLAKDGAAVDLAGHEKADAGRQVCLDNAGDDVDRGTLRCEDQVDARRTCLLREALDQEFDFLARRHHQVGQFVHHHHDLRQRLEIQLLLFIDGLAGFGIIAGLDAAAERLALRLRGADLLVIVGKIADGNGRHHAIAVLHLLHRPFQRADRLAGFGDDGRKKMRDVVIGRQFQHLGVDHDQAQLVRRHPIEQRQDHRVQAHRLAGTGRARDQQMRHGG